MGSCPVPREVNESNLKIVSQVLEGVEWFIFFGSLLGIVRDGRLIDGDDDIDIYVNHRFREEVLHRAKRSGFSISIEHDFFIQFNVVSDGYKGCVDFYFYTQNNRDFILERWNFFGLCNNKHYHLKIPNVFIYPIRRISFNDGFINMPNQSESVAKFLYGKRWNVPLRKNGEAYRIVMLFNRPVILYGAMVKIRNTLGAWYRLVRSW